MMNAQQRRSLIWLSRCRVSPVIAVSVFVCTPDSSAILTISRIPFSRSGGLGA